MQLPPDLKAHRNASRWNGKNHRLLGILVFWCQHPGKYSPCLNAIFEYIVFASQSFLFKDSCAHGILYRFFFNELGPKKKSVLCYEKCCGAIKVEGNRWQRRGFS